MTNVLLVVDDGQQIVKERQSAIAAPAGLAQRRAAQAILFAAYWLAVADLP
jgi:hypothetical protein